MRDESLGALTLRSVARVRLKLVVSPWSWLGVAGLVAVMLYARLLPALVHEWLEFPSLSHGFAVPVITAYLIWARRDRLKTLTPVPSVWGLPIFVVGLATFVAGLRGDEPFVARLSLPITLFGLTLFLAGPRVIKATWMGIGYLVFMIPAPYETLKLIMYRSRLLDADAAAYTLGWLGVPVHHEGVLLHLPNMTLEVADDCSSIPALMALMSLGVAYAVVASRPTIVRVILVAATVPLAVTANIIRITSTAAAVYYIGPWTLRTTYHMFNGTVNFLVTFMLLLLLDRVLASWSGSRSHP